MSQQGAFIHCMLIPLRQHYLLLPNSTVAEVLPRPQCQQPATSDDHLPSFNWRQQHVPLLDLEQLLGKAAPTQSSGGKLCIINGINSDAGISHYALPCAGSPQLITVNEFALQPTHDDSHSDYIHCQLKIGNKVAIIPHLDNIEMHIKNRC